MNLGLRFFQVPNKVEPDIFPSSNSDLYILKIILSHSWGLNGEARDSSNSNGGGNRNFSKSQKRYIGINTNRKVFLSPNRVIQIEVPVEVTE